MGTRYPEFPACQSKVSANLYGVPKTGQTVVYWELIMNCRVYNLVASQLMASRYLSCAIRPLAWLLSTGVKNENSDDLDVARYAW